MDKSSLIIVAIVSIVAVTGLVVMFSDQLSADENVAGQAISLYSLATTKSTEGMMYLAPCSDPDGINGIWTKTTANSLANGALTDKCVSGALYEAYCHIDKYDPKILVKYKSMACPSGTTCRDGLCGR